MVLGPKHCKLESSLYTTWLYYLDSDITSMCELRSMMVFCRTCISDYVMIHLVLYYYTSTRITNIVNKQADYQSRRILDKLNSQLLPQLQTRFDLILLFSLKDTNIGLIYRFETGVGYT